MLAYAIRLTYLFAMLHIALPYRNPKLREWLFRSNSSFSFAKYSCWFYVSLEWHLRHEGPCSNHFNDYGGITCYGIAYNVHPNWQGWKLISKQQKVPSEMIESFYYEHVWKILYGDSLSPAIAFYLFDTACLSGTPTAIYLLQKSIGHVPADAIMGPRTLMYAQAIDKKLLLINLHTNRIAYYKALARSDTTQTVFLNGWINRANKTFMRAWRLT